MGCSKKPKRFEISNEAWAKGWILEDVWIDKKEGYEEWEPHVQAVKNERGDLSLRFCYYRRNPDGSRGAFVNVAMFIPSWTIEDLKEEAKKHRADIILALFKKFADP